MKYYLKLAIQISVTIIIFSLIYDLYKFLVTYLAGLFHYDLPFSVLTVGWFALVFVLIWVNSKYHVVNPITLNKDN